MLPWLMEKDKTVANVLFLQSLLRIVSVYAGAVALIFIAEVIRTKAREKKGVTKYKKK